MKRGKNFFKKFKNKSYNQPQTSKINQYLSPDKKKEISINQQTLDRLHQYKCSTNTEVNPDFSENILKKDHKKSNILQLETLSDKPDTTSVSTQNDDYHTAEVKTQINSQPPKVLKLKEPADNLSSYLDKLEEVLLPLPSDDVLNQQSKKQSRKDYLLLKNKQYPKFMLPENIMDGNQRRPEDPDYDPTTIYIAPEEFKKLSPGMQRFWEIKKTNMDKIVLYRFGDWYVAYYQDLEICSKHFDVCVTPHPGMCQVGFQCYLLEQNIKKLVNAGYKVGICEQKETREQMKERLIEMKHNVKEEEDGDDVEEQDEIKAVQREIVQVYTKGTFNANHISQQIQSNAYSCQKVPKNVRVQLDDDVYKEDFDNRFVLVYIRIELEIGFCFFDINMLDFYVGYIQISAVEREENLIQQFRNLVSQLRPVEVVTLHSEGSKSTVKLMRNMVNPPLITYLTQKYLPDYNTTCQLLTQYFMEDEDEWPEGLVELSLELKSNSKLAFLTMGFTIKYLEHLLLASQTLPFGRYFPYSGDSPDAYVNSQNKMILSSIATETLDIFHSDNLTKTGSLMHYLDYTTTPYGRRLLRKWISMPLSDPEEIRSRQKSIQDLINNFDVIKRFQGRNRYSLDLERMLNRIYGFSIKAQVQIAHDDLSWHQKLTEFRRVLKELSFIIETKIDIFETEKKYFKSERLKQLCTFRSIVDCEQNETQSQLLNEEYGLFDNFEPILNQFLDHINWSRIENQKWIPRPKEGLDEEIDEILKSMDSQKRKIKDYLLEIRKEFENDTITFAHNRKFKFQLEVPIDQIKDFDNNENFWVTTTLKNSKRYLSQVLVDLSNELDEYEKSYRKRIGPLLRDMFERFYQYREHWNNGINCISELDALCALATVSSFKNMIRPRVREFNEEPFLKIKDMRHPCIEQLHPNSPFVPNNLEFDYKNQRLILITGPNMGGKSTFLRTTCLIIIMAQIGCYVPASWCEFSLFNQIFTRIGANDKILEEKSTFFIELEETKEILDRADKHSLVIMDELGRGTSTFDGYAIARSVVNYLLTHNQSRTLFTTHYHWLAYDFRNEQALKLYHMKIDTEDQEKKGKKRRVKFLFKFEPGFSESSFGLGVAEMAGLKESILVNAEKIAKEFHDGIQNLRVKKDI